ncbi:MAG: hypothetical protein RL757_380 [Bacteroidota bacterium]|jgi:subfamily B ATP-binding cassette protein MsbA
MKVIRRLFPYLASYRSHILANVVFNILMVLFSVVSIPMLIPFLQILFGLEIPPVAKPELSLNIGAFKDWFYYQLGFLANTYGKESSLIAACVGIVVVFFFKNLFRYLALYHISPLRTGIVADLRADLFSKTLRLPLSYFSDERKGDLMSRVSADVLEIEWSVLNVLETLVREPLLILGSVAIMLSISVKLTGFVFVLLIFTALIIGVIGNRLKRESAQAQEKLGELTAVLEEGLSGLRVIKAFNAEKYQKNKFAKENNAFRSLQIKALRRRDLSSPMTEFLGIVVVSVLIWLGFKRVEAHEMDGAGFIAFLYAFFTIIEPAKAFSQAYYNIKKGEAAMDRIDKILLAQETIQNPAQPLVLDTPPSMSPFFREKIVFKNVFFKYNDSKNVLENINLEIPKGKIYAFVGASGAGKSTLADLLPRFQDVTAGEVLLDNQNIKNFKIKDLRKFISVVTQEALLFNDSLYNNIAFGLEDVTKENIENAARAAHAHDFISSTEKGYQTNIGDRGNKLSGGQRQRIAIARALLRNAEILVLDEATSALDSESEQLVQAALDELLRGKTAIVIAHRLSTIRHADQIVVLDDGKIAEQGTHAQLIAQKGKYFELVKMQGLD